MIIDYPENFAMKDLNVIYMKNELNNYCKDNGIYKTNTTDRRIMLDMADKFGKYKRKSHGTITYQMPSIDELNMYINENFKNADDCI
jgi:carbamoylphosphate synthase large subunit